MYNELKETIDRKLKEIRKIICEQNENFSRNTERIFLKNGNSGAEKYKNLIFKIH